MGGGLSRHRGSGNNPSFPSGISTCIWPGWVPSSSWLAQIKLVMSFFLDFFFCTWVADQWALFSEVKHNLQFLFKKLNRFFVPKLDLTSCQMRTTPCSLTWLPSGTDQVRMLRGAEVKLTRLNHKQEGLMMMMIHTYPVKYVGVALNKNIYVHPTPITVIQRWSNDHRSCTFIYKQFFFLRVVPLRRRILIWGDFNLLYVTWCHSFSRMWFKCINK